MTTTVSFYYSMRLSIADVVISPRVRRMTWHVAAKKNQTGRQEERT